MNENNVIPFPDEHSVRVYEPGELSVVEEVRHVPLTETQMQAIEGLGHELVKIGATQGGMLLLGIAAMWKVAA